MGANPRGSSILALAVLLLAHACLPIVLGNIVYNGKISNNYDFVIVGGGLAGLVIASRLSEDTNHTVLVLEAGASGDAVRQKIDVPANAYYSSLLGTSYDWQYTTEPQTHAGGRSLPWPRGKVLGGSTAVNGASSSFKFGSRVGRAEMMILLGMYLVRPSDIEVNVWESLLSSFNGSAAWGWNSLFEAMKKASRIAFVLQLTFGTKSLLFLFPP